MKIEKLSENRFQVYLNKFYIKEKELETDEDLEEYFKSFFLTLKNHYHISMEGFYIIQVYQDPFYGMVLQITKEDTKVVSNIIKFMTKHFLEIAKYLIENKIVEIQLYKKKIMLQFVLLSRYPVYHRAFIY